MIRINRVLQKTLGLHLSPTIFTSKSMGGLLSSYLSISHSSTFPTDTKNSCQDFHHLFLREFILEFLYQIEYSSTQWMVVLMFCFVVGSYPVRRELFIRYLDKTSLFNLSIFSTSIGHVALYRLGEKVHLFPCNKNFVLLILIMGGE